MLSLHSSHRASRRLVTLASSLIATLSPALVFAQQAGDSLASQESEITGGSLALISYMALWILVLGVILAVFVRQRKLNAELELLERKLDAHLGVDRKEA